MNQDQYDKYRIVLSNEGHKVIYTIKFTRINFWGDMRKTELTQVTLATRNEPNRKTSIVYTAEEFTRAIFTPKTPYDGFYELVETYDDYPLKHGDIVEITKQRISDLFVVIWVHEFFLWRWLFGKYRLKTINGNRFTTIRGLGTTPLGWAKLLVRIKSFAQINTLFYSSLKDPYPNGVPTFERRKRN